MNYLITIESMGDDLPAILSFLDDGPHTCMMTILGACEMGQWAAEQGA